MFTLNRQSTSAGVKPRNNLENAMTRILEKA